MYSQNARLHTELFFILSLSVSLTLSHSLSLSRCVICEAYSSYLAKKYRDVVVVFDG